MKAGRNQHLNFLNLSLYNSRMMNTWEKISEKLSESMQNAQYKVWISPLRAEFTEGILTVFAMNEFVAKFLRSRFLSNIAAAAREVLAEEPVIRILVGSPQPAGDSAPVAESVSGASGPEAGKKSGQNRAGGQAVQLAEPEAVPGGLEAQEAEGIGAPALVHRQAALPIKWSDSVRQLRPFRFSFDDFVVGPCNELAHAAARSMCRDAMSGDDLSNVLFLCSGPGLGKTHLMQAVGAGLARASNLRRPKVEYVSAEEFATLFRRTLNTDEMYNFKARFRAADVLLLEDIHFLQGKVKTQDELLATLSILLERGSKVVFSSSFSPRELNRMDNQLLSRLCSGLIAGIERPDLETRRRIIRNKAKVHQVVLPDDVTDYLAENISSDIRQIESCLRNLALKAKLLNRAISMEQARETVCNYLGSTPVLNLSEIVRMVCQSFGIAADVLGSKSRKQGHVQARNAAFYLARKHTDLSLQEIGKHFNRTHSTVIKGITSLETEISRQSAAGRQIGSAIALIERNSGLNA